MTFSPTSPRRSCLLYKFPGIALHFGSHAEALLHQKKNEKKSNAFFKLNSFFMLRKIIQRRKKCVYTAQRQKQGWSSVMTVKNINNLELAQLKNKNTYS